ncbi:MAG: GNAT family N-acetyltransferase [Chloroherpetonaceae bacterium]|nr:GNAT family N-acetyltransferase [Chthonomonadaceae bacterium]MDW8206193.1 GNAT family N-acetyltransferase [Chloroherpetonaceae bacterium]
MSDGVEALIEVEILCHRNVATVERTPCAVFLHNLQLSGYHGANRALLLRDDGRGAGEVAKTVVHYYRVRGMSPVADVDPVAEQQGIGAALRRLRVLPVAHHVLLMSYGAGMLPEMPSGPIAIERVPRETGRGEAREWVELVASEEAGTAHAALWRTVIATEARGAGRTQYLARIGGRAAGACSLFVAQQRGRIDDVFVLPEWRRRGVATALVTWAVRDALECGCKQVYLFAEEGGPAVTLYRKLGFEVLARDFLRRHIAS